MLITIMLIAAAALAVPFLLRSSSGGGAKSAPGATGGADRRLRWVERHPGEVNTGDIERLLTADGLCLSDVRKVSEKAFALHIKPFTMFMFAKTYGARELAIAVAAEVSHDTLLEHLEEGTLPNFAELEVFAALNGLVTASGRPGTNHASYLEDFEFPEPTAGAVAPPSRSPEDLEIFEPGDWDGVPDNLTSFEVPSDEPVQDPDFGDWEIGNGEVA